ncbi:uncharacterized protein LOC119080318 isoform X2 [Bradysia coprophila]|uniref:uncharacterized protein LOC119080318 isoform X2 n=1 Tax=Bradysia coprophila TaxID=38358 RepID=UPI00187D82CE|nr:uncharacterized protein LOC119080318 isoform X2 [Bradysia coprophila]
MLNKLEARFRLAGYNNIHFIIISTHSNSTHQDEPIVVNKSRKSNRTMNISDNLKNVASNVTVLNVDADSDDELYSDFQVGSAYVFDQCARLAYIIYYPWSSIQRPYVKASILSTVYDAPCGECESPYPYPDLSVASSSGVVSVVASPQPNIFTSSDPTLTTTSEPTTDRSDNITGIFLISKPDDQLFNASSTEEINSSDDDAYIIPIKVILHAEHVHQSPDDNGTFLKFNYILMRTNDTSYHGHFDTDENAERLKLFRNEDNRTDIQFNSTSEPDDSSTAPSSSISPLDVFVNENGDQYDRLNEQIIVNEDGVVVSRYNEIAWKRQNDHEVTAQPKDTIGQDESGDRAMSSEIDQENDRHYSQILPWIHFNL